MAKQLTGTVVSNSMQNTIVVEIVRRTPHPLYRKLIKRSKKIKAETNGIEVAIGSRVIITETKPISKDKHFVLLSNQTEVIEEKKEKVTAKSKKETTK